MQPEDSPDGAPHAGRTAPHAGRMAPPAGAAPRHAHTFKLRFAAQREPGRSYVSLVKPLGLPATVTGEPYSRRGEPADSRAALEALALARVQRMFRRGPRDKYDGPVLSSHEYGWHEAGAAAAGGARGDRRLQHHIRDSWWLRTRARILAADRALAEPL